MTEKVKTPDRLIRWKFSTDCSKLSFDLYRELDETHVSTHIQVCT